MKRLLNHRAFTVLEAIASIFIISLVLTTAVSIVINVRNHTLAANDRIVSTEVGTRIRDDLVNNTTYADVTLWMNDQEVTVTSTNCSSLAAPFSCNLFAYESNNRIYDDTVTIVFLAPTIESTQYQIIHFEITIEYYPHRFLTLEGMIYE